MNAPVPQHGAERRHVPYPISADHIFLSLRRGRGHQPRGHSRAHRRRGGSGAAVGQARTSRLRAVPAAAGLVRRRARGDGGARRISCARPGVRLRRGVARAQPAVRGQLGGADRPGPGRDGERVARARGQGVLPSSHRAPAVGHEGAPRFFTVRGLRRLCDSRARSSPDVRAARRISFGGDCAAAQGRATGAEPSGERRGAAPPHLVPRQRSRGAFVERGPRLRHRGWRPGGVRDSGVRQLAAPGVSLLRRSARQGAHRHLRASSSRGAGTSSSGGAIPAPHVACTRCSSMSTS